MDSGIVNGLIGQGIDNIVSMDSMVSIDIIVSNDIIVMRVMSLVSGKV